MTRVTIIALNEMRRLNALSRQARKERRRMPSGPAKPRTPGIHPKLIAATVAAVATYLLAQPVLDLPDWVTVVCQALAVGVAAWVAPAVPTVTVRTRAARRPSEAGQGIIELVIVVLVILILIFVLLRVA
jgi:hypothetical protein